MKEHMEVGGLEARIVANSLLDALGSLSTVRMKCNFIQTPRGKCVVDDKTKDWLRRVDVAFASQFGGKRCTWLLGEQEPYMFSAAINDVTACFHRLIERAREKSKNYRSSGRCVWRLE